MKKMITSTLALLTAGAVYASPMISDIQLPGGGIVETGGGVVRVQVDKLIKDVNYDVQCHVTNKNNAGVDMKFDYSIQSGGGFDRFYLNGKQLYSKQGTNLPGDNISSVVISSNGEGNALTFVNLDFNNVVTVSNCVAKPVSGFGKN